MRDVPSFSRLTHVRTWRSPLEETELHELATSARQAGHGPGHLVRELRKSLGLTQEQLVRAAGPISRSYLSRIESGEHPPPGYLVTRLTQLLGLPSGSLSRELLAMAGTLRQSSPRRDPPRLPGRRDEMMAGLSLLRTPRPPAQLAASAGPTELLAWASETVVSLAAGSEPAEILLAVTGPLSEALAEAPPADGPAGGLLSEGIAALLAAGWLVREVLAIPETNAAHLAALEGALKIVARFGPRYRLCLVRAAAGGGCDLLAGPNSALLLMPVAADQHSAVAVLTAQDALSGRGPLAWAFARGDLLAAGGRDLFRWVGLSGRSDPAGLGWERQIADVEERPGGRVMIQRFPLGTAMPASIRTQIIYAEARARQQDAAQAEQRAGLFLRRHEAMLRNLRQGYSYRQILTSEALAAIAVHGHYADQPTPVPLTPAQRGGYLAELRRLLLTHPSFELAIISDAALARSLPLGASWWVKRGPGEAGTPDPVALCYLPGSGDGERHTLNAVVGDGLASEAVADLIDTLWRYWTVRLTGPEVRAAALAELDNAAAIIPDGQLSPPSPTSATSSGGSVGAGNDQRPCLRAWRTPEVDPARPQR